MHVTQAEAKSRRDAVKGVLAPGAATVLFGIAEHAALTQALARAETLLRSEEEE